MAKKKIEEFKYQAPPSQIYVSEQARQNLRGARIGEGLKSLVEGVGMLAGAPIARRTEKPIDDALTAFNRATEVDAANKLSYDRLDLTMKSDEARMKQAATLQEARIASQKALEEFRQKFTAGENQKNRKSRENITAMQGKFHTDTEKIKQQGLTERKKEDDEKNKTYTVAELRQMWEENPALRSEFMEEDEFGEQSAIDFTKMTSSQQAMIPGLYEYHSNPINQSVEYDPVSNTYTNSSTGRKHTPKTSVDQFQDMKGIANVKKQWVGNREIELFQDPETALWYTVQDDILYVIDSQGNARRTTPK